eukprot:615560-Pyramimonas_sp.AAC.1
MRTRSRPTQDRIWQQLAGWGDVGGGGIWGGGWGEEEEHRAHEATCRVRTMDGMIQTAKPRERRSHT